MKTIFLSSTFKDLQLERDAVEAAIDRASLKYVGMEHFGSFGDEPLLRCLAMVRSADVFLLALGHSYGFVPKDSVVSMTESEYQEARRLGIPLLIYLTEARMRYDCKHHPRLIALKEEVKAHTSCGSRIYI